MNKRDILQVRAFMAIYKANSDMPKTERFVHAICATSDDVFNRASPAKIKEWEIGYLRKAKREVKE
jgi:hypothetical protein